jgi:hypothetical protein
MVLEAVVVAYCPLCSCPLEFCDYAGCKRVKLENEIGAVSVSGGGDGAAATAGSGEGGAEGAAAAGPYMQHPFQLNVYERTVPETTTTLLFPSILFPLP